MKEYYVTLIPPSGTSVLHRFLATKWQESQTEEASTFLEFTDDKGKVMDIVIPWQFCWSVEERPWPLP